MVMGVEITVFLVATCRRINGYHIFRGRASSGFEWSAVRLYGGRTQPIVFNRNRGLEILGKQPLFRAT
jgi:hypothetical protein